MTRKNNYNIKALGLLVLIAAMFLGCTLNLGEVPGSAENGKQNNGGTVFNSEWIIAQQERSDKDEEVREGYSIVKTAPSFDESDFSALNAAVISETNMNDGYRYFLVRTQSDALRFRAELRRKNGVLYAQPDYRYDTPSVSENSSAGSSYRRNGRAASVFPFGTGQGNVKQDPEADKSDWGLTVTDALEAFKVYDSSAVNQVLAAIIDTGVNSLHEDFYDSDGNSIIFYAKSSLHRGGTAEYNPLVSVPVNENWDNFGHGTHCAGTIAAVGNNGKGICGVAHAHTKLITYRGIDAGGSSSWATYSCLGDLADIITELRKEPSDRNVSVLSGLPSEVLSSPKLTQVAVPVNMSLGGLAIHPYEVEMMNKALAAGVIPVISMGNNGKTIACYPAALQGILAVGATTMYDTKAAFSNGGSWISVCAPGESIYSCGNGGNNWSNYSSPDVKSSYRWMSGTSMSAPFVTGTIAYLLSINPELTGYQIKTILERTADKIDKKSSYGKYDSRGFSKWYGYGRVNVLKAAECVKNALDIPAAGSVYSEKSVKITVENKVTATAAKQMLVWLYEKQSGICAACGMTNGSGIVSFYGLRTDTEYEIGINSAGTYYTHEISSPTTADIEYKFSI